MAPSDNYKASSEYGEQTQNFLSTHLISPTPVNYSVIYLYITKQNPKLNLVLDQQLKKNDIITSDFMETLFSRFVSLSHQIEDDVLNPFEKTLSNTIEKIKEQVSNEDKVSDNLKKLDKILSKNKHHDSLEDVVSFLVSTINTAQSQHQSLSEELTSTQDEMNQLKNKLEASRHEALVDSLTGLLNRRGCDDKLQALSLDDVHSSLAIDIDHFKNINDQFGHFVGDKVIQRIAKVIKDNVSEQDLAVRFGGEEFVVVLVDKNKEEAKQTAETIRESIAKLKLIQRESSTQLPPISVSIGIAENNKMPDWTTLFEQADTALYEAKNTGRNRCVCV